ncbi:hypothetical protein [Pseudomonas sp. CFBP 13719]|uniref:hypothetical protein n=1 Tax=Pseudomonas sp. CFBP 13719 TaxID=2775303 RepID=UPI0018D8D456|nr:hypothetical protein [Pseudomonas sp. CFBP 13719]
MGKRGSKVVDDIQRVVDDEDSKKSVISRQIRRNEQAQEEQRRIKFDSLARISELYLESMLDKKAGSDVRMVSADIEHLINQREKHYAEIESTVEGDREELKVAQDGYAQAKTNLEELKTTIYTVIANDTDIQSLRKRVEYARDIAENAEALTESITREVSHKLVAYQSDVVFQHLKRRGFDTDAYQGSGLYARLDSWLSNAISYRQARHDFDMMRALPAAAKARETDVEKTYDQLNSELDAAINLVRSTHNLEGCERKLHAASEKLRLCQEHINRDQDAINSFLNKTDDMMRRVRDRVKEVMGNFSLPTLERLVSSTDSSADDQALENYQQAVRREKQLSDEEVQLRSQLSDAEERFRRAKRARDQFKQSGYDRRDREFDSGFDMGSLMLGYMAGSMSLNDLSNRCARDSEIIRESSSSSSSSSSGSFSSSNSFGGSSSNSGFSSSNSFGGDSSSSSGSFSSSDSF